MGQIELDFSEKEKSIEELYSMPFSYKFSKEEVERIKPEITRYGVNVKYCFYKRKSSKGTYIMVVYDFMCNSVRKSGAENNFEVIATREITDLEVTEFAQNFGSNNRRFRSYNYKYIEDLIRDEKNLYGLDVPENFILQSKRKGYIK